MLSLILFGVAFNSSEFAGLEEEITQFAESDILRAILDQGCDPKEYERQYEASLREAERGSVQHYISESENLVSLHSQVRSHPCRRSGDEAVGTIESYAIS